MMKKLFIALLIIIVIILSSNFYLYIYKVHNRSEIKIVFVKEQVHIHKDLSSGWLNYNWEWLILTDSIQKKNWEEVGYILPNIDFKKNFLIMSRYKIMKLYQLPGCDECEGVPKGEAIFNKKGSDKRYYYFYLMPKIWLTQGIG